MNIDKQDERLLHEILSKYKQGLISGLIQGNNVTFTPTGCRDKIISSTSSGIGGGIQSIQEGDNITVDDTDPQNPIISATDGGSSELFPNGYEEVNESRDFNSGDANKLLTIKSDDITLSMPSVNPFGKGDLVGIQNTNDYKNTHIILKEGNEPILIGDEVFIFDLVDIGGGIYVPQPLTGIIYDENGENTKSIIRYLYDQSQNAIPLSGTEIGKPVTGDIETNNKLIFVTPEYGKKVTLSAQFDVEDDAEVLLPRSVGTIALQTDIPFISLENVLLAGNNSENNINVNNGFFVNIIGGGGVVFYTNPDFSDASSIVPMANPYEGLLLGGNEDTSKGLTGKYDYSANITSLSYTQKIYVDSAVLRAIPLSGTVSGSPVTGDIEFSDNSTLYQGTDEATKLSIQFKSGQIEQKAKDNTTSSDTTVTTNPLAHDILVNDVTTGYAGFLNVSADGIHINSSNPESSGLFAGVDFTANAKNNPNAYVQYAGLSALRFVISKSQSVSDGDFDAYAGTAYILPEVASNDKVINLQTAQDGDIYRFVNVAQPTNNWITSVLFFLSDGTSSNTVPAEKITVIQYDAAASVFHLISSQ